MGMVSDGSILDVAGATAMAQSDTHPLTLCRFSRRQLGNLRLKSPTAFPNRTEHKETVVE
jgi:hypothetical protein